MRTLIVEDEYTSRRYLQAVLSPHGECVAVDNGEAAVRVFGENLATGRPFDLVCMDIMMPGMDGITAVAGMRDAERRSGVRPANEAKILMVSALDDPRTVIKAYYQAGATSYLTKPISMDALSVKIREMGLKTD
ncbi:MAG: response regulator [Desulfovibrionaceae bacterium]